MAMPKVYAGQRRRLIAALVANGVAQAVCGFGLALSLRELLREARGGALSFAWLVGMLGLGAVVLGLRVREASDAERLGQDYVMRVRLRIFDRVALRPGRSEAKRRFGVTITRLVGDLNSLRNWVSLGIARLVVASISVAGLLGSLCYFSPSSAIAVVGVVGVGLLAGALATPMLRQSVREARRRRGRLANNLSEKVLAARAVWQLGRAEHERGRIRRHSGQLRDALVRRARWSAVLRSSSEIAWPMAIVAVLASSIAAARPTSELVIAVLLVGMIVTAMGQVARAWDYRISFEEGRRRIEETLAEPRIREARNPIALPGSGPVEVEFDDVGVEGTLSHVHFRAAAGECVLVVGPTGSGKSTLLALATRMLVPDGGAVRLAGVPIEQIELDALHAAVQIVSDDLPLLRGTVAENVGYAAPEEDEEWLRLVAETCGLSDDPALAEAGLETRIEEQGANLPQGLRQRIVLARAIAVRPRLLLVDAPGLLMDPVSNSALERAVALSDATVLIVGSEHGAVPTVDQIWRLPEGRTEGPVLSAKVASLSSGLK